MAAGTAGGVAAECVLSGADGRFSLTLPNAHATTLFASAPGHLPSSRSLHEQGTRPLRLRLAPGGERLSGRVVDATGGAIAGAQASVTIEGALQAAAVADVDGRFELFLAPGRNELWVRADGYTEDRRQVWAPSRDVRVVLAPASSVTGRVLISEGGAPRPLAGASVHVVGTDGIRAHPSPVASDLDGRFFLHGLSAGTYSLFASAEGWRSQERTVTLGVSESAEDVVLEVLPAATLSGEVLLEGAPCTRGALDLSGPVSASARVGDEGELRIAGLLPGAYDLRVRCGRGVEQRERLELRGGHVWRRWDLDEGLTVRGIVETPQGEPVAGARVVLAPSADGPDLSQCETDALGEFACTGLAPGNHDCWVETSHPIDGSTARLSLERGRETWLRLRSSGTGSLHVHIRGEPPDLASLNVVAQRSGGPTRLGRLGADGFIFEDLVLGDHEVRYEPPGGGERKQVTLVRPGERIDVELPAPRQAGVVGVVEDEAGLPVGDAWVQAWPSGFEHRASRRGLSPTLTDERGAFRLAGLPPGDYDVEVSAASGSALALQVESGGEPVLIELPSHASVRVYATVSGRAVLDGFTLAYRREGSDTGQSVEVLGDEWLLPSLAPGRYRFSASAGQATATRAVEIQPGAALNLRFELQERPGGEPAGVASWGEGLGPLQGRD